MSRQTSIRRETGRFQTTLWCAVGNLLGAVQCIVSIEWLATDSERQPLLGHL